MSQSVIIMAAGESVRWGGYLHTTKHLAPLGDSGQTIIGPTIEMVRESGIGDISVVARDERIIEAARGVRIIQPARYDSLADSILSSRGFWGERTVILLGDVYFTRECLDRILGCTEDVKFFGIDKHSDLVLTKGRRPELYSCVFSRSAQERVARTLEMNSALAGFRDRGKLRILCLKAAVAGKPELLRPMYRISYSPKPPSALRKSGAGRSDLWRVMRSLYSKPRRTVIYGKLWGLYVLLSGIGPFDGPNYEWPSAKNAHLDEIDDITQDIDTAGQYESLLKALGVAGMDLAQMRA